MWLKEALVGEGSDDSRGRVPDGGYALDGKGSILFAGALSEADHESATTPFELVITGGTGMYRGAYGYVLVDPPVAPVFALDKQGPPPPGSTNFYVARKTVIHVCIEDDDDSEDSDEDEQS